MNELTSQQIADWHRIQAKKHNDLAVFHRKTAEAITFQDPRPDTSKGSREILKSDLTLEQLEIALREKAGRVNHVAARLQVSEETIYNLLADKNCKYEVGDRGFIYAKPV